MQDLGRKANRLCDPCCGSGIVAWDLAERFNKPVVAGDLQQFATIRAAAVLHRLSPIANYQPLSDWIDGAEKQLASIRTVIDPPEISGRALRKYRDYVKQTREYADTKLPRILNKLGGEWPASKAYAGHYFSIEQALLFDILRRQLPKGQLDRELAMASLVSAASRCCASPGHTAQPFQRLIRATRFIREAWERSPKEYLIEAYEDIGGRYARQKGAVITGSCGSTIGKLEKGDLIFFDPPYSGVHYSRFYHVLETICRGRETTVSGSGRYPPFSQRPASAFSRKGQSGEAMSQLIGRCAAKQLKMLITFPLSLQSNGLSGEMLLDQCKKHFASVTFEKLESTFSSLGGGSDNRTREARMLQTELLISCA